MTAEREHYFFLSSPTVALFLLREPGKLILRRRDSLQAPASLAAPGRWPSHCA